MDAVIIGRAAVDLYANEMHRPLSAVQTYTQYLGGCPANIAAGIARLGLQVGFITRVGTDALGAFVQEQLRAFGIDSRHVRADPLRRTALALAAIYPPDRFDLSFYRQDAADLGIEPGDIDPAYLAAARLLLTTGTGLSGSPSRESTLGAMRLARQARVRTAFVIDHRPAAWPGGTAGEWQAQVHYETALRSADIAIGNAEEVCLATGLTDWAGAARRLAQWGADPVVVTRGAEGAAVLSQGRLHRVPPHPVQPLNVLGGGDAFTAGFIYGLLRGWSAAHSAAVGAAAGALVVSRHGCSAAMPTRAEVEAMASQSPGKGRRQT